MDFLALLAFGIGVLLGALMVWLALKPRLTRLQTHWEADREKLTWVDRAEKVLRETHREELKRLVEPVEKTLEQLNHEVRTLEQKRESAYGELHEQLRQLAAAQTTLQTATHSLSQALRSTGTRARWGELQLRRLVEFAGMTKHVDFSEQVATEAGRPDLTVHLPEGGVLAVDAKAPMQAYLEALELDGQSRDARLDSHVRALKQHVQQLAGRRYWEQFQHTPELVIMFVPNEAALAAAFERDPGLLESAIQQRVLVTSPISLLGLLKAVAYGWQQHHVAENARTISELGKQLYNRLKTFLVDFIELGKRLDSATKYYNEAVGALEQRVFPSARRLGEMSAQSEDLPPPARIERQSQVPSISADLTE